MDANLYTRRVKSTPKILVDSEVHDHLNNGRAMPDRAHPTSLPAVKRRLKLLRLAKGLKKSAMARLVGTTPQAWGNWESETTGHRISVDEAVKLCQATGAKLEWIYRGEEDSMPSALMAKIRELDADPAMLDEAV